MKQMSKKVASHSSVYHVAKSIISQWPRLLRPLTYETALPFFIFKFFCKIYPFI